MECAAKALLEGLNLEAVFIHGTKILSAAANGKSTTAVGYFVERPKILTGGGDHCNAGFLAAYLCDCGIEVAARMAAAVAAFYVANATSPSLSDIKSVHIESNFQA
jgi:sugar/nucleoside kinase (ribokinase family)